VAWNQRHSELLEYKEKHGNCTVPRNQQNKQLGAWVINQRVFYRRYKQGKKDAYITAERIQKLEAIGFEWNAQKRPGGKSKDSNTCVDK